LSDKANELLQRLKKNTRLEEVEVLTKSDLMEPGFAVPLPVPALNILYSGDLDGGLNSGLTVWAGPSKHFKSLFMLLSAKAYMDKYPDSVFMLYVNEFGTPKSYFRALDIDMDRVLINPVMDAGQFKRDVVNQLNSMKRKDRIFFGVDSVGNMASTKELSDALEEKDVQDMSRAKELKSVFRTITPYLTLKDVPMLVVNHVYQEQKMYGKTIVSGGSGIYLSADDIYIISRAAEKDKDKELVGFNFNVRVEKSRHVREGVTIPIQVLMGKGINRWSGLLDIGLELGFIVKPKSGEYQRIDPETGEVLDEIFKGEDATETKAFWAPIASSPKFKEAVRNHFKISAGKLIQEEEA
jgi:RecA/RadA recombinase